MFCSLKKVDHIFKIYYPVYVFYLFFARNNNYGFNTRTILILYDCYLNNETDQEITQYCQLIKQKNLSFACMIFFIIDE